MAPNRHRLLSVVGLSPQVITEALYYFWHCLSPPIPISEVIAVTTEAGLQALKHRLLAPSLTVIESLCIDYSLPPIHFDQSCIHVLKESDGRPLQDIWTRQDNEAVADQIFALVRRLTEANEPHLHASIAGGRKTMGLYLGLAMQFYGRPGDTLSHVLVSPELESNPNFVYPPPGGCVPLADGRILPAHAVRVELAQIPLLLLGDKISLLRDHREAGYSELIRIAQQEYNLLEAPPPVELLRLSRTIRIGEVEIRPRPLEFALYLVMADRRLNGCSDSHCPGCKACTLSANAIREGELTEHLRQTARALGLQDPRYELSGWEEDPLARFRQILSKLNQSLREKLSEPRVSLYQVQQVPGLSSWGKARYGLLLPKAQIRIE